MIKKPPPAKVSVRFPGRPFAELVDPEYAAEIGRMKEEATARIIRNLEAEKADRDQRQERWRPVKQNAKITLAQGEEASLQWRLKVHRAARRKLGLPE
jgi:hypothetical protein